MMCLLLMVSPLLLGLPRVLNYWLRLGPSVLSSSFARFTAAAFHMLCGASVAALFCCLLLACLLNMLPLHDTGGCLLSKSMPAAQVFGNATADLGSAARVGQVHTSQAVFAWM